jgi:phosphoglycerol transferase MdoB-like AlkP superfamily enzyme
MVLTLIHLFMGLNLALFHHVNAPLIGPLPWLLLPLQLHLLLPHIFPFSPTSLGLILLGLDHGAMWREKTTLATSNMERRTITL